MTPIQLDERASKISKRLPVWNPMRPGGLTQSEFYRKSRAVKRFRRSIASTLHQLVLEAAEVAQDYHSNVGMHDVDCYENRNKIAEAILTHFGVEKPLTERSEKEN